MRCVEENSKHYVIREGRRIEVETEEPVAPPKTHRKMFKTEWVKFPRRWAEALQQSESVSTYRLALVLLFEAFKCKQTGGEVVLSFEVTGMPRSTKVRAAKELAKLGLIQLHRQDDNQAYRIYLLL